MNQRRISALVIGVVTLLLPATASAISPRTLGELALPTGSTGLYQGYLPLQSCPTPTSCSVAGIDTATNGNQSAFVESQVSGVYQAPVTLTPPNGYVGSQGVNLTTLTCPKAGYCSATGQYGTSTSQLPFSVTEIAGKWQGGSPISLPSGAAVSGQYSTTHSEYCGGVGNCIAVGTYTTKNGATEGFIVPQRSGRWLSAFSVTLPGDANVNPLTTVDQLTCSTLTTCVAVGSYLDHDGVTHGITVSEVSGQWYHAQAILMPANASAFAGTQLNEATCLGNGICVVGGTYNTSTGAVEPLALYGSGATWKRAVEINLPHNANTNPRTLFYGFAGLACPASGSCTLGGQYLDNGGKYQGFLANMSGWTWRGATELSLPQGAQQAGHNGGVVAITCVRPGVCEAGAAYIDAVGNYQAYVVGETNDVWNSSVTLAMPNRAATVGVDGGIYSLTCFSTSLCQASGSYQTSKTTYGAFSATLS